MATTRARKALASLLASNADQLRLTAYMMLPHASLMNTQTARQKWENLVARSLVWLLRQALARLRTEVGSMWLCALTDQRSDDERKSLYDQTVWMFDL
jgi:hypothetical protein